MTDKPINPNVGDPDEGIKNLRKLVETLSNPIESAELSSFGFIPEADMFMPKFSYEIPETISFHQLNVEEQIRHNEKLLKILGEIRDNTAPLPTMLELIADNHDSQNEILKILNQIFEFATARNKEELKNKHWKVIEDINNLVELGESSGKLILFAQAIYTMVSLIIKH